MPATTLYKRSNFATHLPVDYLYSPSHFWIARVEGSADRWRIGFTKFATRMLGEVVDFQLEKKPGDPVRSGEIVGSIEGFKAISDIYCVAEGTFVEGNAALRDDIELVSRDPYGAGWLYAVDGMHDPRCGDVESYRRLLDSTIDRILEKQKSEGDAP
jgi:glycine cleavage system H protein